MHFIIERLILLELLKKNINIINKKSSIIAITHFLFEVKGNQLTLYATNLEIYVLSLESIENLKDGTALIKANLLFDLCKKMTSKTIEINANDKKILIIDGSTTISLSSCSEAFPSKQIQNFNKIFSIDGMLLHNLLSSLFIEMEEGSVQIKLIKNKLMVTLFNNRRMSYGEIVINCPINSEENISLPMYQSNQPIFSITISITVLDLLIKFLNKESVDILLLGNEFAVHHKNMCFISKMLAIKNIPDPNEIIHLSKYKSGVFERRDVLKALETAITTSSALSRDVQLIFTPNLVQIKSFDLALGGSTVSLINGQSDFYGSIRLNCQHLIDIFKKNSKDITFFYQSERSPFFIQTDTNHILMPLVGH